MSASIRCLTLPISSSNYGFTLLAENAISLSHPASLAQGRFWRIPVSVSRERPPSPVATRPPVRFALPLRRALPRMRGTSHIAICDIAGRKGHRWANGCETVTIPAQRQRARCALSQYDRDKRGHSHYSSRKPSPSTSVDARPPHRPRQAWTLAIPA